MVLRAKPDVVLPEFLPFFMQSDLFMERAKEISVGSLSPTINWKTLAKEEFELPPPEEQGRIASVLNGAELVADCLRELCDTLQNLRKASLIAYFDQLLTNPLIRKVSIDIAGEVLMGRQRSPEHATGPSMRPYLRVANVFDDYIDTSDVKEMNFSDSEYRQFRLRHGDVLLNEGQSRELVGRSAIFREDVPDACFQNTLIRFRPSNGVTSEFAHRFFQYCLYTGRFVAVAKQTTSIAHLGVLRFSKMLMPLPSRNAQAEASKLVASIEQSFKGATERYKRFRDVFRSLKVIALSGNVKGTA
jgi:type I restriction enzyme, S subunit